MSRLCWFVLILAITGCQAFSSGSSSVESPRLKPGTVDTPLAEPALNNTATPAPQPRADLGVVKGTLVQTQQGMPYRPMAGVTLYLARIITSTNGTAKMAALDKKRAPMAVTDEAGRFVFQDIEPNTYALAFSSGALEFLIRDPDSDEDIVMTVVGGQTIDLGELYVELP